MTNETESAPPVAGPGQVPFVEAAFEGALPLAETLLALLRHLAGTRALRLCWCDEDFAAWPLGRSEWLESLTQWMRSTSGELVMVAARYDAIEQLHPRFVDWRSLWAHRVHCLVPEPGREQALPTLWLDDCGQVLRVFDRLRWRGRAGMDRADRQRAREEFDAITQRASPGFAAVTLGL